MLNHERPQFGTYRQINGEEYELYRFVYIHNESDIKKFNTLKKRAKQSYASVRTVKNSYGTKAIYVKGLTEEF